MESTMRDYTWELWLMGVCVALIVTWGVVHWKARHGGRRYRRRRNAYASYRAILRHQHARKGWADIMEGRRRCP